MNATATRTFDKVIASRRFDPRAVVAGVAILVIALIVASVLFHLASQQADRVATPVSTLCQRGGTTAVDLNTEGACGAAGEVATGVGPYKSATEVVTGDTGAAGATGATGPGGGPGTPGAPGGVGPGGEPGGAGTDGTPGTPGAPGADAPPAQPGVDGTPGANGSPGESPACLAEASQCRGADGLPGPPPPCLSEPGQCRGPEGRGIADTQVSNCRLIVIYTDGNTRDAGSVCATESAPEPATTEPPVEPTTPGPSTGVSE